MLALLSMLINILLCLLLKKRELLQNRLNFSADCGWGSGAHPLPFLNDVFHPPSGHLPAQS